MIFRINARHTPRYIPGDFFYQEFMYWNHSNGWTGGIRIAWNPTPEKSYTTVSYKTPYTEDDVRKIGVPVHGLSLDMDGWSDWHGRFDVFTSPSLALGVYFDYKGRETSRLRWNKSVRVLFSHHDGAGRGRVWSGVDYRGRSVTTNPGQLAKNI